MSSSRLATCITLPLENKVLVNVIEKAKDWALMHGVGMRDRKNFTKDAIQIAPFVLLPSPFPRNEFYKALELQTLLNELMHKVAHDAEFLAETLQNALEVDEFTANLFNIWTTVRAEGVSQMPENKALSGLCSGITEAYDLFGSPDAVVIFVVEEVSYNICDQRFHEFEIAESRPDIQIHRKTLGEIYDETELNSKQQLILDSKPVAVVYYRSGYEPAQYPTSREWDARLRIERSTAIKCPSIHYQLAGTKKVQQALAVPGALERLLGDNEGISRIRNIFTGLYSLDFDESGERAVEMALKEAERFVLKPQREGGGNNLYGADVREALIRMRNSRERAAYILMERINPPLVAGYVVRAMAPVPPPIVDLVSELGIFGVVIGTKDKIICNKQVGHMLRTKLADADEGGVAAGLGALDSPYLVDV